MTNFEQAFSETERAADSALKSAGVVTSRARDLAKAARTGNIAQVRRQQANLKAAMVALSQEVDNANSVWPFHAEDEERYLQDGYTDELIAAAEDAGLSIYRQDDVLISYPSIVRVLPGERAVRIDRRLERGIKPSHLAQTLLKNQRKKSGFLPASFLRALYAVYSDILSETESNKDMVGGSGRVVPLTRIYRLMTVLPGVSREYGRNDFARDLYIIQTDGPQVTRQGYRVTFHASTATRQPGSSRLFEFIDPDGQRITYYGIRFSEDSA